MRFHILFVLLAAAASPASAALLLYDGFDYETASAPPLAGNTNPDDPVTWTNPSAPAGTALQRMAVGNVSYPGLPAPTGDMVNVPRAAVNQNRATRINLPDGPVTTGSLFFSFTMKLNSWANLNAASSRSGSNAGGGFIAGFHAGVNTDTMSPAGGYASQLRVLRYVDPTLDPTALQPQRYHLGVVKNNLTTARSWYNENDVNATWGIGDIVFVVGEYQFNSNSTTDDVARLWINPTPGDPAQYASPTVVSPAGTADASPAQIGSFYFFGDTFTGGNFHVDELRIGTAFRDVIPVPEPAAIYLACVTLSGAGIVRRQFRKIS